MTQNSLKSQFQSQLMMQCIVTLKKGTKMRANSRPWETYKYIQCFFLSQNIAYSAHFHPIRRIQVFPKGVQVSRRWGGHLMEIPFSEYDSAISAQSENGRQRKNKRVERTFFQDTPNALFIKPARKKMTKTISPLDANLI